MDIAVYYPDRMAVSIEVYANSIMSILADSYDVSFKVFNRNVSIPKADLFWDPQCGRGGPPDIFEEIDGIKISTFHGAANLTYKVFDILEFHSISRAFEEFKSIISCSDNWWKNKKNVSRYLTVSQFAKSELEMLVGEKVPIDVIYHGVLHDMFKPKQIKKKYNTVFHSSVFQKKKNLPVIYQVAKKLEKHGIKTIIHSYGIPKKYRETENIAIISDYIPQSEISKYLSESDIFLFPSFHETFGIPLIEAMASANVVISSNTTACNEIVNNPGYTFNPRDVRGIGNKIIDLLNDDSLLFEKKIQGLDFAQSFSWGKSAQEHYKYFSNILAEA